MQTRHWKPILIATLIVINGWAHAEGKRIKKWVDEDGVTHYGDVVPPAYGEKTTEMNSQGITVKRKPVPANPKEKQGSQPKELTEQERRDKALLDSFTTEKEIDLARDRNLQMDQATIQSLNLRLSDAEQRLQKTNTSIAEFSKNKKPVPADLTETQKLQQAEVQKIREQIAQKQASMDATRARFDNDKKRFIELKSGQVSTEEMPASAADAVPEATPAQPAP